MQQFPKQIEYYLEQEPYARILSNSAITLTITILLSSTITKYQLIQMEY